MFEFHLRDYEAELESGPGNGEQRLVGGGGGAAAPADRRRGRRGDFLRHFDADLARLVRPQDDGGVETGQRRHLTALVFGQEHLDRVGRTRRRLVCVTKKKAPWSMIESVETVATPRGTEFSWLPTFLKWLGKVSSGSLGIEMIRCVTRKCGHGRTMLLLLLFFWLRNLRTKKSTLNEWNCLLHGLVNIPEEFIGNGDFFLLASRIDRDCLTNRPNQHERIPFKSRIYHISTERRVLLKRSPMRGTKLAGRGVDVWPTAFATQTIDR